jgi:predicted TIM-barrel fold metal-dependent hydrolase
VNVHEHLLYKGHLDNYLPAARAFGVEKTVIVASPQFTLFGKGQKGEPIMSENFAVILEAAKDHPDEIVPFFTVSPEDKELLARAKRHVAAGGKGIKLYTGHSNLHDRPLDAPELMPLYAYLEDIGLPINWHVNLAKWHEEFDRVMSKHPKLNVMVPHYGVCFWRPEEHMPIVARLMRKYPNLYVDTSLGTREILIDGLYRVAEHKPLFQQFFEEFQDRIVWGTDAVITGNLEKTPSWYAKVLAGTRDQLERDHFQFPLAEGYSRYFKKDRDPTGVIEGLALPEPILKKVYKDNALRWLERPAQLEAARGKK